MLVVMERKFVVTKTNMSDDPSNHWNERTKSWSVLINLWSPWPAVEICFFIKRWINLRKHIQSNTGDQIQSYKNVTAPCTSREKGKGFCLQPRSTSPPSKFSFSGKQIARKKNNYVNFIPDKRYYTIVRISLQEILEKLSKKEEEESKSLVATR